MLAGFVAARPDHEPAEQALRHDIVDGLAAFYDQDRDRLLERIKLTFRTPALHPRLRQQQADWAVGVAALLADRLDARPDDLEVRAIAAAVAAALFVAIDEDAWAEIVDPDGGLAQVAETRHQGPPWR